MQTFFKFWQQNEGYVWFFKLTYFDKISTIFENSINLSKAQKWS